MKKLLLLICLLFCTSLIYANKIDSLTDKDQVAKFISPLIVQFTYRGADKKWEINSWQKLDLNNDGLTDLIATEGTPGSTGKLNLIAIDLSNGNFQLIKIASGEESIELKNKEGVALVIFHGFRDKLNRKPDEPRKTSRTDTLIYKYGNFVELNTEPDHYEIDSITFSLLWGWYGSQDTPPKDPHRDRVIEIDHSGNTTLTNNKDWVYYILAKGQQKPRNPSTTEGVFNTTIKKADLEEIYNLIDYISIKKLNERYTIHVTDMESNYIRVKFSDGSIKYIADYGGQGTWGLRNLFSKFYALIKNQDWK
jgi:hypothetical protein